MIEKIENFGRFGKLLALFLVLATIQSSAGERLNAQEESIRRMAIPRTYPRGARDISRARERETHRGFEVDTDNFTVVANTSREDARLAAAFFEQAYSETNKLLDPWTDVQHQPTFGRGSAEITIDKNPLKRGSEQETTLTVIGIQMIVYLNVGPGNPPLEQQIPRLQMAAVHSVLHAAHLDRKLPTWVRDGMATYVAEKTAESAGVTLNPATQLRTLDSDYWMRKRISRDELEPPPTSTVDARAQVRFLLEGNDAKFANPFFASLNESVAEFTRGSDIVSRREINYSGVTPRASTAADAYMETVRPQFETWKKNPLAGQPVMPAVVANQDEQLLASEREVATLLKLVRRFDPGAAPTTAKVKITEFGKDGPREIPAERNAYAAKNLRQVFDRMMSTTEKWATLDANGKLLLSTDRERIENLMGINDGRYSMTTHDQMQAIRARLPDGRIIEGWLEENRDNPARPLAKFALANR